MKLKMMKIRILSEISKDGEEEKNDDREGRNESKAEVDDGENIICKCLNKSVQQSCDPISKTLLVITLKTIYMLIMSIICS